MTGFVVDASVAIEVLLKTPLGLAVGGTLEDATLAAPELLDVEVLHVLRNAVLHGRLDEARALTAIDDLELWPVERLPHAEFARSAWQYRHNVSAYDAFYVAVADALALPLLTADGRLSRASGLGVAVQHVSMS
ncbi:MAG: type II toxin-antitoxin system VapC family toxin [Chloroflexi bacterium]|nr:type II toxin-antitoxin system VapC family toxin [Chloroflexota bacterium]MYA19637.1 type II toxin-antitoxin system VapC family toxin [Chloroflexota bacterium]MYE47284.1 type II toxin-antitoxin system VapC family toxin [Chloroflexota bacterium]